MSPHGGLPHSLGESARRAQVGLHFIIARPDR